MRGSNPHSSVGQPLLSQSAPPPLSGRVSPYSFMPSRMAHPLAESGAPSWKHQSTFRWPYWCDCRKDCEDGNAHADESVSEFIHHELSLAPRPRLTQKTAWHLAHRIRRGRKMAGYSITMRRTNPSASEFDGPRVPDESMFLKRCNPPFRGALYRRKSGRIRPMSGKALCM